MVNATRSFTLIWIRKCFRESTLLIYNCLSYNCRERPNAAWPGAKEVKFWPVLVTAKKSNDLDIGIANITKRYCGQAYKVSLFGRKLCQICLVSERAICKAVNNSNISKRSIYGVRVILCTFSKDCPLYVQLVTQRHRKFSCFPREILCLSTAQRAHLTGLPPSYLLSLYIVIDF